MVSLLTTATPMETLLNNLGPVVTAIVGWVGNVATTITSNPILLLTTGFLVLGGAVGIFGRLLSKN
jgi:hypothetical protein